MKDQKVFWLVSYLRWEVIVKETAAPADEGLLWRQVNGTVSLR